MKALKRGSRHKRVNDQKDTNGPIASDSEGFNAKVLGRTTGFDKTDDRKMKLNTKPLKSPPTVLKPKPKIGETAKKVPALPNLRAVLNLNRPSLGGKGGGDTKNLMDDQSVASFGYKDSARIRSVVESARARAALATKKSQRQCSGPSSLSRTLPKIPNANSGDLVSQEASQRASLDSTANMTMEPVDMFDSFTQQRKSSLNSTAVEDPFGNTDAFASNSLPYRKAPAVERATVIDEEQSAQSDSSTLQSDSRGRGKKSKMQKITELLNDKKEWKEKNRALRREIATMEERLDELEAKLEESGDIGTRAEVLRSVADTDEKLKKMKKELEKAHRESKMLKKQVTAKKGALLTVEKELDANLSEVSTLRKELSQALQQVDMLEEEQEGDKEKILKLTKDLAHAGDDEDDYSDDGQTVQEQLEVHERSMKKKDRQIEKQRIEVEDQVEHLLRLKAELERAQTLLRENDDVEHRIAELTESNKELKYQLDSKVDELEYMERVQTDTINEQASELQASERKRKQLIEDLKESNEEVDDLRQQKQLLEAENAGPRSRSVGEDEETVDQLKEELDNFSSALSASKRVNELVVSQNEESRATLEKAIGQLEGQNKELQSKLAASGPQAESLEVAIEGLREENESLETTVLELKGKIGKDDKERAKRETSLGSQISSLRSSLDASQNLHQQSEDESKRGVSEMQSKLVETELALEEMKVYNEELEASADELRETSADFEQELQRSLEDRGELQMKVDQLQHEIEEAGESAGMMEELRDRLVEVQEQAFTLSEKNQSLENHVARFTEENEYLKETVEETENDAAEAQQAVSALEDLMEEYDELQDDAQEMREKAAAQEGEVQRLRAERGELQAVVERREEEVKEARELLAHAEEKQKDLETLQLKSDEIQQHGSLLGRKLEEVTAEREVLSLSVQTIEGELEESQAIVVNLQEDRSRLLVVELELEELRNYKESTEISVEELHRERDEWMEIAKEAKAEAETKQAAISALKESNHEYSAYEVEAAELRAIVDSNELKIEQLKKDKDDYRRASQEAVAELEKAQTALLSLEEMMEEYDLLQEESEKLSQDNVTLESHIEKLALEKGEVEKTAAQATADIEEAESQLNITRQELAEKEDESHQLILKNTALVVQTSELEASIDELEKKAAQAIFYSLEADSTRKDLVEIQERLHGSEVLSTELRVSNGEVIMELETLNEEYEKLMTASDLITNELDESKQLVQALEKKVEEYDLLHEELTSLKTDPPQIEMEIEETRQRLQATGSGGTNLQLCNIELQKQIESLGAEKDEYKLKTVALDSELVDTNIFLEEIRAKSESMLYDTNKLREDREKVAGNLEALTTERDQLVEKNMEVQLSLADKDATLATLQDTTRSCDNLQDELGQLRKLNDETESRVEILTSERDNWKNTSEKSMQQANEAGTAVCALEEQMEQMRNVDRDVVNGEMKSVQIQIDDLLNERTELKTALAKEQDSVATAETEVSSLRCSLAGLAALQIDIDRLKTSNAELSSQLASLVTQRDEMQSSATLAESTSIEAKSAMTSLEADRDELRLVKKESETLREQNMQVMLQVSDLQSKQEKLISTASRVDEAESALGVSRQALLDSEKRVANIESKALEAESDITSLEADRHELQLVREESETLREQNMQAMLQIADLQSERATPRTASSRVREAESALDESRQALFESEKRFADLESRYSESEVKFEELLDEREEMQDAVEKANQDISMTRAKVASAPDAEKDHDTLLKKCCVLSEVAEEAHKQKIVIEQQLKDLLSERDALLKIVAIAEDGSVVASKASSVGMTALQIENAELRDRLNLSAEDDAVVALEHLQQDYSDLLHDNDRLQESMVDFESEIDDLVLERDEWIAQAQKATPATSPETSRSATELNGMDGMQELCEELQRQLQSMTRDRDTWQETAESATRVGNKGVRRRRSITPDDSSVMSDMSDQKMLLQQAVEYRDRRDSKKPSGVFSFTSQRPSKEVDPIADEFDREQLIDSLTEAQEQNQQSIDQLKKEVVELNRSLKEDAYSSKKRTDVIEQENSAYELKVMALEHELERLDSEGDASMGVEKTEKLQRDLEHFQSEKKDAEREIASLQVDFDKLHRATTQEVVHKQTKIDHLKTLQGDFEAKVDALENMMLAINQENETLREIAQKAGNFSIDSDLGKALAEDDKDVKIAQLSHELIELRMQGHQQLTNKVFLLEDEKRQMQDAMEQHFEVVAEENETLLEDLEMRLQAREQTIKALESALNQISGHPGDKTGGSRSSDGLDSKNDL